MALHHEIWAASKNTLLEMMLSSISVILRPLLEKTVTSRDLILDGNQFHSRIIDAIESGDAKAASDLMHAHLMLSARNYEYYESFEASKEE
jgi:DNA-binding GntR family transcriptional regulator